MLRTATGIVIVNGWNARRVGVGDSVTIGRGPACDIRLLSPYVSRRACRLRVDPARVAIANESSRRPLIIRPPRGADRRIEPMSVAALPDPTFDIIFAGADDTPIRLHVDARALSAPRSSTDGRTDRDRFRSAARRNSRSR